MQEMQTAATEAFRDQPAGSSVRTFARLSLADIANPAAGVINYGFAELTGSSGLNKTHFVQGAPGRMVVGSLDSTSQLRIFTWLDSSNSITANTVGITHSRRARPTRRSLPTASTGWQSHSPATSPARRTSSFQPNPAVAFVWHPDYAYAMAALGSSGEEMGMTLAVGGGTLGYPSKQSASGTTSSCSRLRTATRHRSLGSETTQ